MKYFKKFCFCFVLYYSFITINSVKCEKRIKRLDDFPNEEFFSVTSEPEEDFSAVEIICSKNFKKESNSLHRQSLCRPPRKQLVAVKMPSKYYMPGVYHRPNSYEVDRCDGVCQHPNHKCLPIEKEFVEVPVTSDFIFSRFIMSANKVGAQTVPTEKCMRIKIEKHLLCGCKCIMNQHNCNEQQVFSQDKCNCECKETSRAKTCAEINKMWSNEKCDCVCPPTASRDCSSGAFFDDKTCRCIQTNG